MFDYRKFTISRNFRIYLLSLLSWMPDALMIRVQYLIQTGHFLHLKQPKTFGEIMQAYKLYYRNPEMHRCVDKGEVRSYVREKGYEDILVPLYGLYDSPEKIDFGKLPKSFIMKTTDGGGNNEVKIIRDKALTSESELKDMAQKWMQSPKPKKHIAREWAYENEIPRKILIEQLLQQPGKIDIDDYKFFCYDGKFKVLEVHRDRSTQHTAGHYDANLNYLSHIKIYKDPLKDQELPQNIGEMIKIVEKLSEGFPFVRVDLYNVRGKIYFGEMTFYPASGYFVYRPESVNTWLGSFFKYPFERNDLNQ